MKATIFYENSFGIMAQWAGEVIAQDEKSISIRFSKNKAFKYNLTQSGFCLVTKTKAANIGLDSLDSISFDENLREQIIAAQKDNTSMLWNGDKWNQLN
jgi:hypothetical protein